MKLDLHIWSTFINALFGFAMVVLTLYSRPLSKLKWLWMLSCMAVALWSAGLCIMSAAVTEPTAYLGCLIVTASAIFIPVFLWHMTLTLLGRSGRLSLLVFYGSAIALEILLFTGFLVSVRPFGDFPFYTKAKPLYALFMVHLYGGFLFLELSLWRASRQAAPLLRKQILSILWGTTFGFIGGQMCIGICYDLKIFPWGVLFASVYVLSIGYGMFRYQLMDFRLSLRKFGLTLLIYACVTAALTPIAWPFFKSLLAYPSDLLWHVAAAAVLLTILVSSGPVIYALITHKTYWLHGHSTLGLVHELKSPLSGIIGASQIIKSQLAKTPGAQDSIAPYTAMLEQNVERLENHISDLLQLASLQEGPIELHKRSFSLNSAIEEVANTFRSQLDQKQLDLIIEADKLPDYFGDAPRIRQAFSNLLSNSIKFSNIGQIRVELKNEGRQIRCSVTDQGSGISSENLDRIFDRFFQGKNASKGSGIGLSIAKAWIEAHGGRIWAESEGINKGTTLGFNLPL